MKKCIVWLRRDLRVDDHHALSVATQNFNKVYLLFVFDENILKKLNKEDARLVFISRALENIEKNSNVKVIKHYGDPVEIVPEVAASLNIRKVLCNKDYEVYAKDRDLKVSKKLNDSGIEFESFKDTVVFEFDEMKNKQGGYYKVFTPFKNNWFEKLDNNPRVVGKFRIDLGKLSSTNKSPFNQVKNISEIGFSENLPDESQYEVNPEVQFKKFKKNIESYHKDRDFPAIEGTSKLSVHLRFGTISIRYLVREVLQIDKEGAKIWLSELAWRDFYFGILDKNPKVETRAYLDKYNDIDWENDKKKFKAWCAGKTGVPIVDAAMRELNQTGWMHNRARMIVASYLVKTLLINWQWGEKYFAEKLIDFDLAANNGGWQWSASTGCDAAPYFRVFNPHRQSERFDQKGEYIKKYCPELLALSSKQIHNPSNLSLEDQKQVGCVIGKDYPEEIANYKQNRIKVIDMFAQCTNSE